MRTAWVLCMPAIGLIAGGASVPVAAGQAAPSRNAAEFRLSVAQTSGTLHPGGVGLLLVTSSAALSSLDGEVFGQPVRFWPGSSDTQWRGLAGVGLGTAAGTYTLVLRGTSADGRTATARAALVVEPKRYETRRLKVDPNMANPPPSEAARIAADSKAMSEAFATVSSTRLWRGPFLAPVPGAATSSYGRLTIMNGAPAGRHQGADFRAASGTPVRAPNAGRVALARDLYFAGNTVILDHGLGVFSLLAHLSRISVAAGDPVGRGDVVGASGATGRVTGPHLHWAVRFGETSVDPVALMSALADLVEDSSPSPGQ